MRRPVAAAMLDRERLVPIADAAQQLRQVLQPVGDDVDHLAFPLHPAVAGDHPGRQHQPALLLEAVDAQRPVLVLKAK